MQSDGSTAGANEQRDQLTVTFGTGEPLGCIGCKVVPGAVLLLGFCSDVAVLYASEKGFVRTVLTSRVQAVIFFFEYMRIQNFDKNCNELAPVHTVTEIWTLQMSSLAEVFLQGSQAFS